jgi:hypothetical protein
MGLIAIGVHASLGLGEADKELFDKSEMVELLAITDLCLFTDARYMRHPSMADLHTAFQDHPTSLEHFPSGSFSLPPRHIGAR